MIGKSEIFYWGEHGKSEDRLMMARQCAPRYLALPIRVSGCSATRSAVYFLSDQGDLYSSSSLTTPLFPHLSSQKIIAVSSGLDHSLVLTSNGNLYSWGKGEYGVLGLGDSKDVIIPEKVQISKVMQVACGLRHTLCLTSNGVYYWGCDYSNDPNESKKNCSKNLNFSVKLSPNRVHVEGVQKVAAGDQHCLLLNEAGDIWAFGCNFTGQLGLGLKKSIHNPAKVKSEEGVKFKNIAAGSHSAAVSVEGNLFVWGTGIFGEWLSPKLVSSGNFDTLSLSSGFGVAMDRDFNLYSWGNNTHGQLGLGDFDQRTEIRQISIMKNRGIQKIFTFNNSVIAVGKNLEPKKKYRRSQQMNKENIPYLTNDSSKNKEIENLKNQIEKKDYQIKGLLVKNDDSEMIKIQKENEYFRNAFEEMKKFKQQCYYSLTQESEKRKIAEGFVKELHNEHKLLVSTIEELEKTMAKLSKQCELYQEKAEKHDILLERFQNLIEENAKLKGKPEGFSYRYKNDYSCESITLASPDVSLVLDRKYKRDNSPDLKLRTSKSSSELLKMFEPIRSTSPSVVPRPSSIEPQTPPTFRDRGLNNSGNVKNSLSEIRARLNMLQENKLDLEGKMNEFEKKLKEQV